jgi:hypothetical protein
MGGIEGDRVIVAAPSSAQQARYHGRRTRDALGRLTQNRPGFARQCGS